MSNNQNKQSGKSNYTRTNNNSRPSAVRTKSETNTKTKTNTIKDTKPIISNNKNSYSNNHNNENTNNYNNDNASQISNNYENDNSTIISNSNRNDINTKTSLNQSQTSAHGQKKKMKKWVVALIIIGVTLLVGGLGTLMGGKMRDGYKQPPLMAPDWLFPVAWTINYILIGTATFLVYLYNHDSDRRRNDFIWYGVHLFFNLFWPLLFFRLDLLIFSCIWLLFNVISAIIVNFRYYKSHLASGIIFTMYTIWLLYALYLNLSITLLNV